MPPPTRMRGRCRDCAAGCATWRSLARRHRSSCCLIAPVNPGGFLTFSLRFAARNDLAAANETLTQTADQLERTLARSLLRPLGFAQKVLGTRGRSFSSDITLKCLALNGFSP